MEMPFIGVVFKHLEALTHLDRTKISRFFKNLVLYIDNTITFILSRSSNFELSYLSLGRQIQQ